ncbi:unnamed protein product [Gordionus sp. m RMFG-2023]|uniref:putative histone H1.6 n=1 Tax=Gordionus sp. m RMFG-2023 TaxID=3053472 RepID=UPI0030DE1A6E
MAIETNAINGETNNSHANASNSPTCADNKSKTLKSVNDKKNKSKFIHGGSRKKPNVNRLSSNLKSKKPSTKAKHNDDSVDNNEVTFNVGNTNGNKITHSSATKSKKNLNRKRVAIKTKAIKKDSTTYHPPYNTMILQAVSDLLEKGGASISKQAIVKYILQNYELGIDMKSINSRMKIAIKRCVESQTIKQISGSGATGSFRLNDSKPVQPHYSSSSRGKMTLSSPKKVVKKPKKLSPSKPIPVVDKTQNSSRISNLSKSSKFTKNKSKRKSNTKVTIKSSNTLQKSTKSAGKDKKHPSKSNKSRK